MIGDEKKKIFRNAAIERLSSPEQLDQLMEITDTKAWIALAAVSAILVVALIWGIFGTIPTTVQGQGILLMRGGLYDVQTLTGGQVEALGIREGLMVRPGDLIAEFAQPDLERELSDRKQYLLELLQTREAEIERQDTALRAQLAALQQQRELAQTQIETSTEQIQWLENRLTAQLEAAELGLISRDQVERTRQEISAVEGSIVNAYAQIEQIQSNIVSATHAAETATLGLTQQIATVEREIASLEARLEQSSRVHSAVSGRVLEVLVDEGQIIAPGTNIATVELADSTLGAVVFIPGAGKRPEPGMTARILPANVNWEESGFLESVIDYVSQAPISYEGTLRYVKNDALARAMLGTGNPYVLEAHFLPDTTTSSGYRWTSGRGPDLQVTSGMLATAQIDVERHPPITLVIPALRRLLGI